MNFVMIAAAIAAHHLDDGHPGGIDGSSRCSGLLAVGTNNLQPAARAGVDRETKAVQLYDRGHQIEAEAHARRVSYLVGTIEAPQYRFALLFADAAAGIRDADDGFVVAA